jgi:hypothetical protein
MFGRRRRPLVRAAAVGGAGYAIGKRRADNQAEDEAASEDPAGADEGAISDLEALADLKDRGVLTQEEFDEQKAKILGST